MARIVQLDLALPLGFGLAALAVRLINLGSRSLWGDEAFSVWLAGRPFSEIVGERDFHPPGYYLLLKAWSEFPQWAMSDAGVRLPSAFASAGCVALAVWLVGYLRWPGAWLVGMLGLTSAISVWYAQEARMYAPAAFAVLVVAAALTVIGLDARAIRRLSRNQRVGAWTAYVVGALCAMYFHYDAVPIVALLTVLCGVWLRRNGGVAPLIAAAGIVVLGYAPQLPRLAAALADAGALHTAGFFRLLVVCGLVACGLALGALFIYWRAPGVATRFAPVAAMAALLLFDVIGLTTYGASVKRHLAIILPLLLLGAGALYARRYSSWRSQALILLAGLPALILVLFVQQKDDWRAAGAALAQTAQPGDVFVISPGYQELSLERYFKPQGSIVPAEATKDLGQLATAPGTQRRLWLIEATRGTKGPDAPSLLGSSWRSGVEWRFYGVTVQEFEPSSQVNAGL